MVPVTRYARLWRWTRSDCLNCSKQRGIGKGGGRDKGVSEEITFDLFGAIEDFNDTLASGEIEKSARQLSVNACQGLRRNDVLGISGAKVAGDIS